MSERAPDVNAYVYQPDPPKGNGADQRIFAVGGIPPRLTKDEAAAIVDAINEISWLGNDCPYCGHVAHLASTACPQCGRDTPAPWRDVAIVKRCGCERCLP